MIPEIFFILEENFESLLKNFKTSPEKIASITPYMLLVIQKLIPNKRKGKIKWALQDDESTGYIKIKKGCFN